MRLIDADKLQQFPIRANRCDKEHANTHFINGIESVLEYAEQIHTVDAEVVVYCKACKYYKPDEYECGCDFAGGLPYVKENDFCSYGKRKDGDGDE